MAVAAVRVPHTIEETGVPKSLLEALALKTLYIGGELSLLDLADRMQLSYPVAVELFERLRREQLCEVKGMDGGVHRIATTSGGKKEALDLLSQSQYAGPAPVSLKNYNQMVRAQSVKDFNVHPEDMVRGFRDLVLTDETLSQLGTAIVSGRAVFLYGPTGTGKTFIAETIPSVYQDSVWVPYAVEVDGQVVVVYDADMHVQLEGRPTESDGRWVLCRRPRVLAGGELTIEMLDLQFNPVTKYYASPLQMKANNGVLILDDFGRQRARPEELLNRWIAPLERRTDYLTLVGGKKFELPFDMFLVFSTNLDPSTLGDEAFLRRIQTKVKVGYVTRAQFHEIFRRLCLNMGMAYDAGVVDHVVDMLAEIDQPMRPCYPRDFMEQIRWRAQYEGRPPALDREAVTLACRSYFVAPDLQGA
ncbi:MAG TPA: hypothetical protein VL523_12830 [Terriglobia bacterium]|nr:hypothetical protein [Terriglobia bacterium]